MLVNITDTAPDLSLEDPVRPQVPMTWRQQHEIWAWQENNQRRATVCVAWLSEVPDSETSMMIYPRGNLAVAYSIWSLAPGAGRQLIQALQAKIMTDTDCQGLYTLSPLTEMARRFHLSNGARVYRINQTSINYQYQHNCVSEIDTVEQVAVKK